MIHFQNGTPVLDRVGNPTGGLRSPYLEVAAGKWFASSPGPGLNFLLGYVRPFDQQHLTPIYQRHDRYVEEVIDATRKLVSQRYLTREDGEEIIRHAEKSDVPTLADIPSDLPDDVR